MEKWIKKIMQFGGLFLFMSCNQPVDVVTIDLSREEAEIPPSLYGIFFEEITHSGDGGLYAEMIRNRGFEDGTLPSGTVLKDGKAVAKPLHCYSNDSINHFSIAWNDSLFMESWEVKCVSDTRPPFYEITEVKPLNNATPHALFIDLGASASDVWVMNDGYWGIAVTEGQRYNFQFYLFTEELKNTVVTAALLDREEQIVVSKNFQIERDGSWNHYEGTFTVDTTANDLRFALLLPHKGKVYIDFVSMFPENTFCGHKNGLREDVAGMLRDLRPDFVRWPGGCIVEGLTMDNRIKWKEMIGDIVKRPGEYNLWGYRSTYGFGYHEFLQFCEDIDADGMFVCNAGMSCLFRNGDYWEEENRPDVNLHTDLKPASPEPVFRTNGFIGLGTNNTEAQFKDLKVIVNGEEIYTSGWSDFVDKWTIIRGDWKTEGNLLSQSQKGIDALAILEDREFDDCTIELKAKKISGTEGFRIVFGGTDSNNYFMADIGSHTNESVIFREVNNEGSISLFDYRNTASIKTDQWYTVRIEIKGAHWKCFLNDELQYEYTYAPKKKHYVVSGYDRERKEVIVKLVNAEAGNWKVRLQLDKAKNLASKGTKIVLGGDDRFDENSFSDPLKIVPKVTELSGISNEFTIDCQANSLTVLRIPCEK